MIQNRVSFDAANFDHLAAALESASYRITHRAAGYLQFTDGSGQYGTFQNGQFRVPQDWDVDAIKRQYSQQIIQAASKKYGWKINQGAGGKLQLKKRAF